MPAPLVASARMMSRSETMPPTSPRAPTMTMAPMRLAASLLATSSNVALGLAVVTARPFCLRIAATFMAFPPIRSTAADGLQHRAQAPSLVALHSASRLSRGLAHRLGGR